MGNQVSGLGNALYNSKRREFLGRDGAAWGKLGVFYFFFYIGLAGFFCAMLAVFMAFTPRDHPYYTSHASRMETRSNPLSPGLGFRPQPDVDKNLIAVEKDGLNDDTQRYIDSLNQYLQVFYWKHPPRQPTYKNNNDNPSVAREFVIRNPGPCTNASRYGYSSGRPCVLVKMNKIVDFDPEPIDSRSRPEDFPERCAPRDDSVIVACQGEYPADIDNIGRVTYYSEDGANDNCGSLQKSWFPYKGKDNRIDTYQAPYVWAQFNNPKPNVLINVICRAYAQNIDFDKKTGRGLTRFQIFVAESKTRSGRSIEEI